jgi:hypothetical protein
MADSALKSQVYNRGKPTDSFLDELIAWGREAPDEIFAPNAVYDIYSSVFDALGPYRTLAYRRAVMLEVLRVLAGYESSWDWNEGVDTNNPTSITPETIEAGAWQVSANSMRYGEELRDLVIREAGTDDPNAFQAAMKSDHRLAMEYVARLLRRTTLHHGPVKRHEIDAWLKRGAVDEFLELLGQGPALFREPAASGGTDGEETGPINYRELLPRPARQGINQGLTSPSSSFMTTLLGLPRSTFTGRCQPVDNVDYLRLIDTRRVGPIRVTGLKSALDSLGRVFEDVKRELPELHALIGTEGMMCCRYKKINGVVVRDPSNHTWGAAVDLTVGGVLDDQGDNKVQRGLLILSRYFNAHGWYWGAAFPVEDAMHFEVSRELLQNWRDEGVL